MLRTLIASNPSPMTLDGTRTFIIGDHTPAVIDPGPIDDEHLARLVAALHGRVPVSILLTHLHPDHAAGAPALAARTGAQIYLSRDGVAAELLSSHPVELLSDGNTIQTDGGPLRTISTPGHSPEHFSFVWSGPHAPGEGAIFVGDLLIGSGDTTLVAPPEGNLRDYLVSLRKLEEIGASVLYPSHGPPIIDPAAALARYRAHRLDRIAQVADALEAYPEASTKKLVSVIYGPSLDPSLEQAAAGSIQAVMDYLAGDHPI
jgi:glyoxylase-like metal-dependent hydrolase (beta-lactamase superfamily II)